MPRSVWKSGPAKHRIWRLEHLPNREEAQRQRQQDERQRREAAALEDLGKPTGLWWWPDDPAEAVRWENETLATIRQAVRAEGRKAYEGTTMQEARDDLETWLTLRTVEFRLKAFAGRDTSRPVALDDWCAVLYTILRQDARRHWHEFYKMGLSREETSWVARTEDRIERTVVYSTGGSETTKTVGDIGVPLWTGARPVDPLEHVLTVERLTEAVAERWGIVIHRPTLDVVLSVLDRFAPEPGPGECMIWGCPRPRRHYGSRNGLCHYHQNLERWDGNPTCSVDGCDKPQRSGGLCQMHYARQRKANARPCSEPGCDKPIQSKGLCPMHYRRARKAEKESTA